MVIPNWKGQKGMGNLCPKCRCYYEDEEYDFQEDLCITCLFPQSSVKLPVMFDYSYGDRKNITGETELLDDLEYRPTTQSDAAKKAKREYDWRNYEKKGRRKGKVNGEKL